MGCGFVWFLSARKCGILNDYLNKQLISYGICGIMFLTMNYEKLP